MKKNKLLLYLSIIIVSFFIMIRSNNVYDFRMKVVGLVIIYNENHYYYGQIRKIDEIIPSYYDMLFSFKPLKYEYWINEKNLKKLTERNDILI